LKTETKTLKKNRWYYLVVCPRDLEPKETVYKFVAKGGENAVYAGSGTDEYEPSGKRRNGKQPAGWLWAGVRGSKVAQHILAITADPVVETIATSAVEKRV
jgi:hypothetical protein